MALNIDNLQNYKNLNQMYNNADGWSSPVFGNQPPVYNGASSLFADPRIQYPEFSQYQGGPQPITADSIIQNAMANATSTAPLTTPTNNVTAPSDAASVTVQPVQTAVPIQQSQPIVDAATLRAQALGLVDQNFGVNYGERNIGENFLDETINNLLTEQQNNAQSYLDRGKARGIYNDIGYDAGRNTINNSADAGRSSLAELARGVLDKYQARANTVRDTAYNAATSVDENRPFKIDPYLEQGNQVISDAQKYASGDLKGAFGNTQLFDFGALNNKAGQAQGALNLRDTDLATAVKERNRKDSQSRGIGNTGAF